MTLATLRAEFLLLKVGTKTNVFQRLGKYVRCTNMCAIFSRLVVRALYCRKPQFLYFAVCR